MFSRSAGRTKTCHGGTEKRRPHFGRFARMHSMNRRTWLRASFLSLFLPTGITEAMERTFLETTIGSPDAQNKDKGRGDAMTASAKVYELRIYHVVPGKLDDLIARF